MPALKVAKIRAFITILWPHPKEMLPILKGYGVFRYVFDETVKN